MKVALVLGVGFIGSHMATRLRAEGYTVRGLSRRSPSKTDCHQFAICDLRYLKSNDPFFEGVESVYNFACEVGGLGYIANRANDADILHNSTQIDLNVIAACRYNRVPQLFFASSACVYNSDRLEYREEDAIPAAPDNEFGWQKLFAERLYYSYGQTNKTDVRIARLFNCYGIGMPWTGGREKSVAALCRKVAEAKDPSTVRVWGDGTASRSFLHVSDAAEGIWRLMQSTWTKPLNIGPHASTSIRELLAQIAHVSGKTILPRFVSGPVGVQSIAADTSLMRAVLQWEPQMTLRHGLTETYPWVAQQVLDSADAVV